MAITGYLSEFSLPELLKFLQEGRKTGLLTLVASHNNKKENHYLWIHLGRIVAAGSDLDNQGLIKLIDYKGFINSNKVANACPLDSLGKPMGICLKSHDLLDQEQLRLLFYVQVMQQMCILFKMQDAWFNFDTKAPLPMSEMTGLSTGGKEATLSALRALRDWSVLQERLPEPTSGLINTAFGKPGINLNQMELKVWEFANGNTSLNQIAKQLQLPVEKVQKVAFRLMTVGLADEVPMVEPMLNFMSEPRLDAFTIQGKTESHGHNSVNNQNGKNEVKPTQVSQSFLNNLMGFLKTRTT